MAAISKAQAAHLFTDAVKKARPDELAEFYNELFPNQPTTEQSAQQDPQALVKRVLAHIQQGLEVEEVLDFWNVVFPERHRLRFDEEDGLFHFGEHAEDEVEQEAWADAVEEARSEMANESSSPTKSTARTGWQDARRFGPPSHHGPTRAFGGFIMSNSTVDYTHLLREAIRQAKANAPRAVDDLLRCASKAAEAVAGVTGGAAALELVPLNQGEDARPTYQLQLRKVGSEAPPSDLGVYCVTAAGYPVLRWYSRKSWESRPDKPDEQYPSVTELEGNFTWLVSKPESRLVLLVAFFQQQGLSGRPSERTGG